MSSISVCWVNVSWGALNFETNYGLMQHSHLEIKDKLLRALDAEYNVVDTATVFEVVAILEKIPITSEILEATRLGKVINEFRRKTNNEVLAKRAKELVRRWREMIIIPSVNNEPMVKENGTTLARLKGKPPDCNIATAPSSPLQSNFSPLQPREQESVSRTHASNKRLRKDVSPGIGEPYVKIPKLNGIVNNVSPKSRVQSVDISRVSSLQLTREQELLGEESNSNDSFYEVDVKKSSSSGSKVMETNFHNNSNTKSEQKKKRGRKKKSSNDDIIKEKLDALTKTVKIKTTQELVAELGSNNNNNSIPSSSMVTSVDDDTSLYNNLHVPGDQFTLGSMDDNKYTKKKLDPEEAVNNEIKNILKKLPPINVEDIKWDSDDENENERKTKRVKKKIDEKEVERIIKEKVESVNGNIDDNDKEFKEWHQVASTTRGYNNESVYLLPYTIVD